MILGGQPWALPRWDDVLAALLAGLVMGVCDVFLLKFMPPPTRWCVGFACGSSVMMALAATRQMGWARWPLVLCLGAAGCAVGFYGSGFLL